MKRDIEAKIEYLENHTSPGTTIAEHLGQIREEVDSMHELLLEMSQEIENEYNESIKGDLLKRCYKCGGRYGGHSNKDCIVQRAKQYLEESK